MNQDARMAGLEGYVDRVIVIDTKSTYIFIGTFRGAEGDYFVLEDADVHDCAEGKATKELYVFEAKRYGVHPNRTRVLVSAREALSVSGLDEVTG